MNEAQEDLRIKEARRGVQMHKFDDITPMTCIPEVDRQKKEQRAHSKLLHTPSTSTVMIRAFVPVAAVVLGSRNKK